MAEPTEEKSGAKIRKQINDLFTKIGQLTKIQRLLICLVTAVAIGAGYYFLVFSPKYKTFETAKKELKAQEDKLVRFKRQARALAQYEEKMAEVQERFNIAMNALPDNKELPALLTGISKAGSNAGLEFLLFQPEPIVTKDFYKEIPLSMTVNGTYHQVADFFFQVAELNRIVNIRNMSMKAQKGKKGAVQMKCSAVTYMFAEPSQAPNGKKKNRKKKRG